MLHGFAFDIMAYEGWSPAQKRDELYRVIAAMAYQPGDEKYVRKFTTPNPDVDPRVYQPWMQTFEGEMSRIMQEMMAEMMLLMMPGISDTNKAAVMAQFKMKMMPGFQQGEQAGSLHDALMAVYPQMQMMPGAMEPGQTPQMMVDAMLKGYSEKHGAMLDIAPYLMPAEPSLPPMPAQPMLAPETTAIVPDAMIGPAPLPATKGRA